MELSILESEVYKLDKSFKPKAIGARNFIELMELIISAQVGKNCDPINASSMCSDMKSVEVGSSARRRSRRNRTELQ